MRRKRSPGRALHNGQLRKPRSRPKHFRSCRLHRPGLRPGAWSGNGNFDSARSRPQAPLAKPRLQLPPHACLRALTHSSFRGMTRAAMRSLRREASFCAANGTITAGVEDVLTASGPHQYPIASVSVQSDLQQQQPGNAHDGLNWRPHQHATPRSSPRRASFV